MRAKPVPVNEQYRLVMECRASGMTDYQWCVEHDIKPGTFYNWVKRLRQSGCENIPPASSRKISARQEVVKIDISGSSFEVPDFSNTPETVYSSCMSASEGWLLELFIADATLRIPQGADLLFLKQIIRILRETQC
ncbi:MAG: helix-turn-helix domain-containing protein [Muribaculaceae bacterium]|nr:helix-turn-helix domain-containing protein [Muribaculaceae bacterium]